MQDLHTFERPIQFLPLYVRVHKAVIITLLNAVDGIGNPCTAVQSVHWALCLCVGRSGGKGGMGVCQVVELVALVQLLRGKTWVGLGMDRSPVVGVRYGGNGFLREAPTMKSRASNNASKNKFIRFSQILQVLQCTFNTPKFLNHISYIFSKQTVFAVKKNNKETISLSQNNFQSQCFK